MPLANFLWYFILKVEIVHEHKVTFFLCISLLLSHKTRIKLILKLIEIIDEKHSCYGRCWLYWISHGC